MRVPRTRGALSGLLLILLGAWAGIVPFIGPYLDFAYTPAVNDAWNWTAGRGWLNVGPGAAAFFGGLLLLLSASRVVTLFGGWLAAAAGAWLIVGPTLAVPLTLGVGRPDPASSGWVQAMETLFFYLAIGAAILFLASVALGRLSVQSVRDVRAAERRADEAAAAAEQRRLAEEQALRERAAERDREPREGMPRDGVGHNGSGQPEPGRHERIEHGSDQPTVSYQQPPAQDQPTRAYTPAPPPPEQRP
jgi:MFS family permease